MLERCGPKNLNTSWKEKGSRDLVFISVVLGNMWTGQPGPVAQSPISANPRLTP